ncbi:dihydrofolate reductase family protein [Nocardioides donggukensis]|uniref:Dihydrofolate reductase family protein n=1 Tax=Nocardioides donggukensis TaxID=2774019 RepID=A0A927PYK9_9ACTN|nr:dihydrofolate reductase family protein [Nocardioides donggukensis]MBD8868348.1 dihydrofolate reductase family protein [Nocardioides donggukensis]
MRALTGPNGPEEDVTDARLEEFYAPPRSPWLRVNMVSAVDGAATGADGRSGSVNNAVDKRVFDLLRRTADAVLVGAGTAAAEGYRPADCPIVVVSRRGRVPTSLLGGPAGSVLVATCSAAPELAAARAALGEDCVLELGSHRVDLPGLRRVLADRGLGRVLCEGGPHLLRDLLAAGAVDELCATTVPRLLAGDHRRITSGPPVDVDLELGLLLEEDGTLLGRWLVRQP